MPSAEIPTTHLDLLEKPLLAHCATIGPRGEPQNNPIWFLWNGERIVFAIDPNGQKAKNIARDPSVSLSIADSERPEHYLEIRGTATFDGTVSSQDPTVIALVRKYTGNDSYPGMPEEHALYLVEPLRTTTLS